MYRTHLYLFNALSMTPIDTLVCSCTFLNRSVFDSSARNAINRVCTPAHSCLSEVFASGTSGVVFCCETAAQIARLVASSS